MPDPDKNRDGSARFEKLGKSVLETNNPLFVKIKRELPFVQSRNGEPKHPIVAKFEQISRDYDLLRFCLIGGAALLLSFFIYRQITDPFLDYRLGDIAQRHLIAQRTMEMVDEETTEAKRRAAESSILSVYDYDRRLAAATRTKIAQAFNMVRKQHQAVVNIWERRLPVGELEKTEAFIQAKKEFSEALEIDMTDSQFETLVRLKFASRVERIIQHLLADVNLNLIVSSREQLKTESGRGITLNRLDDGSEKRSEITFNNVSAVIDVEAARNDIELKARSFLEGRHNEGLTPYSERIVAVAKRLVVPNLTLNRQETDKRRLSVKQDIKPVIMKINKGESIVRYGETINTRHLAIMRQMEKDGRNDNSRFQFFFTAIFLSIVIFSIASFLQGA